MAGILALTLGALFALTIAMPGCGKETCPDRAPLDDATCSSAGLVCRYGTPSGLPDICEVATCTCIGGDCNFVISNYVYQAGVECGPWTGPDASFTWPKAPYWSLPSSEAPDGVCTYGCDIALSESVNLCADAATMHAPSFKAYNDLKACICLPANCGGTDCKEACAGTPPSDDKCATCAVNVMTADAGAGCSAATAVCKGS